MIPAADSHNHDRLFCRNDLAWWRCYGDPAGGPMSYQGSLDAVFNSSNKLWAGKDSTRAHRHYNPKSRRRV
jgi:hypothetical protein